MSDLPVANYLELAAGFHMIWLLANPAEATRSRLLLMRLR